MTRPRTSASQRLATQTLELSLAAPQVVAQRLTRMALAGAHPSARDRQEFTLMGAEKMLAFQQSWAAMWMQAWRMQMEMAQTMATATLKAAMGGGAPRPSAWMAQLPQAATRMMAAGLTPVHGKAVANAKRLARQRK